MAIVESRSRSEWQDLDRDHYLHPFTDYKDLGEKKSRIITRADSVYIYDADGNKILDGMSGLWCVNAGYGRDELVAAAEKQLRELPYYNSFFQCAHPPSIELSRLLKEITQPQFNRAFYAGSGSESIDTMIRMVRRYWELMDQPDRQIIIARENAYHGSTIGGTSLGGMKLQRAQGGMLVPGIEHIGQPYWFGSDRSLSPDDFGLQAARYLEQKIEEVGADKVAAFVGEPIQGAGGVIVPPETYWPEIQRICDEHGILLVTDEVICGFGRLGEWFGADYYGVRPDLMTFAKGVTSGYLPLGGVMVGDRVSDVMIDKGGEFYHGYTYSGHPVACAAGMATLDVYEDERLFERAAQLNDHWIDSAMKLKQETNVIDVRCMGLIGAVELAPRKDAPMARGIEIGKRCYDKGFWVRNIGDAMVFSPPLIISEEQITRLFETLAETIREVE